MSNNDDGTKSIVLNLETLSKEYDVTLKMYTSAQSDYINSLSKEGKTILIDIKGQAFWGTNSISGNISESVEDCKALCSNTENCSGATFNSDKKYCWIRSGNGSSIPALPNDYAIIPSSVSYLNNMKNINIKLADINKKILDITKASKPLYNIQDEQRFIKNDELNKNYEDLNNERDRIDILIKKYEQLDNAENISSIDLNRSSLIYIILFVVLTTLITVFINFIVNAGPNTFQDNNRNYFILILLILLILTYFIYKYTQ